MNTFASTGFAGVMCLLLLTGCDPSVATDKMASLSGKGCTVQFRRDALGAAMNLPVNPLTQGINGAETAISGTFKTTQGDWVVVEHAGKEVWIPRGVILAIEFSPGP